MLQRSCSALRLVLLLGGLASLLSPPLQSQTAPPDNNGTRVFQANARIVVLDVVVTGKNRHPLTGLHQNDFVLSEDGHPQIITHFEEHTGAQPLQVNPPDPAPNISRAAKNNRIANVTVRSEAMTRAGMSVRSMPLIAMNR